MKKFNPWDRANLKARQVPRQKYGAGKFGAARLANRRPGVRGK